MNFGAQLITCDDGSVVGEALVGVHHAGEINTGGIVVDECRVGCLRQDNGEGRRGNHICVPCRAGCLNVVVEGVFCVNCSGKFADLFAADNVGVLGRVDPAHNLRVNAHDFSLPFLCTVFSSNAQSGQTTVQVTGMQATSMQACSISSHFLPASEGTQRAPTSTAQAGVGWTDTRNLFQKEKLCLPT